MNVRVVTTIATAVALGVLGAKGIEAGCRKALEKSKEAFDKKVRDVVEEKK
jgi:hypothetical protein